MFLMMRIRGRHSLDLWGPEDGLGAYRKNDQPEALLYVQGKKRTASTNGESRRERKKRPSPQLENKRPFSYMSISITYIWAVPSSAPPVCIPRTTSAGEGAGTHGCLGWFTIKTH
jgi:hypothetical protein